MQIGQSSFEDKPESKRKKPGKSKSKVTQDRLKELKERIEEGYYSRREVLDKIINKLVEDM